MFYILCIFLAVLTALGLVYLKNHRQHMLPKGKKRRLASSISGQGIGDFIREQKHAYILDIRSDDQVARKGIRHSGSVIIMYIPFEPGQEDAFVKNMFADSRMRTAREEQREILIVCDEREYGTRVAALLVDHQFHPLQICDNLDQASEEYLRIARRPTPSS
ncbi:hypothetical protein HY413_01300 [Candidatus Kaiserbacteria bacterium]|nr:hypothetical protein [Candidatus Kaiserbacteria bacterium]